MKTFLDILSRLGPGVIQALKAAWDVLSLVLKGRRVEAELAQAKLREQVAKTKLISAENFREKVTHQRNADIAAAEARELEAAAEEIRAAGKDEIARIKSLPGHKVHREYLELAKRAKEKAQR